VALGEKRIDAWLGIMCDSDCVILCKFSYFYHWYLRKHEKLRPIT